MCSGSGAAAGRAFAFFEVGGCFCVAVDAAPGRRRLLGLPPHGPGVFACAQGGGAVALGPGGLLLGHRGAPADSRAAMVMSGLTPTGAKPIHRLAGAAGPAFAALSARSRALMMAWFFRW